MSVHLNSRNSSAIEPVTADAFAGRSEAIPVGRDDLDRQVMKHLQAAARFVRTQRRARHVETQTILEILRYAASGPL